MNKFLFNFFAILKSFHFESQKFIKELWGGQFKDENLLMGILLVYQSLMQVRCTSLEALVSIMEPLHSKKAFDKWKSFEESIQCGLLGQFC